MCRAVLADPNFAVLERSPFLGLPDWWCTAGAVFQNVWNQVEGRPAGYGIKDYDLFYFDDSDLSWEAEEQILQAAKALFADLARDVEVRNQARAHRCTRRSSASLSLRSPALGKRSTRTPRPPAG